MNIGILIGCFIPICGIILVMEVYYMLISTEKIIKYNRSKSKFTKVTKTANKYGDTIIFKRNKPAYVLFDIEKNGS